MTTSTEINYAERVARGVALLDRKWPNWRDEVDLGRLDIASGSNCMTAQYAQFTMPQQQLTRANEWEQGQDALGLDDNQYALHGFNVHERDAVRGPSIHWFQVGIKQLNELWRDLIVQHRYAPEPRQEGDTPA